MQITHDAQGKANAVLYLDKDGNLHRQAAKVVCVAGNSIETPRLLLLSASSLHPNGLANSSGQVGRNYMRHTTGSVYARFDKPVHMYRGETMAGIIADEARLDTSRGFAGGYYMETLSLGPAFLAAFVEPGGVGAGVHRADGRLREHRRHVDRRRGHAAGDQPGHPEHGRSRTSGGCRSPDVNFDDHPNDIAMREHGYSRADLLYEAVGATGTHHTPPYPATHNLGTCRMSDAAGRTA